METSFYSQLQTGLDYLGIELPEDAQKRLYLYFTELKKWQKKVNLIAKNTGDETIVENHFLDSLTLLPHLHRMGDGKIHLVDIGTGAGFPGLVCKAACPEMVVSLVEPRLKRVSFLKHIVRILKLEQVNVLAERMEPGSKLPADGSVTHVTGRAVTEIGPFVEMAAGFVNPHLQLVLMKGPKWKEEEENAGGVIQNSGYSLAETAEYSLPFSGASRTLLFFTKIHNDQR